MKTRASFTRFYPLAPIIRHKSENMVEIRMAQHAEKRMLAFVTPMLKMLQEEGEGLRVLDAGCGDGSKSELIIRLGNEVWGIDKNSEALSEAEKRGVKVLQGDLEKDLPFRSGFFDGVWCSSVLEHVFHTCRFLKECHRVLKPKGFLIVNANNIASLSNRLRLFFGFYPKWVAPSENYPRFASHVRVFTKPVFQEALTSAGFKVEKITADLVCFNPGWFTNPPWSESLGKILPSLGEVLIIKARK
jgi:ubiquinone/menaquinone biosynthesis C-methylase UbiE